MSKRTTLRKLDALPKYAIIRGGADDSTDDLAPPLVETALEPPTHLVLTPVSIRSASTPMAGINATWDPPHGVIVDRYTVQTSTTLLFTAGTFRSEDTVRDGGLIENLIPGQQYWVRVSAWEHGLQTRWSDIVTTTTLFDTVAPNEPTSPAASYINSGDLQITWIPPSVLDSPNFRDVEIRIWDSAAKGILWYTAWSNTGVFVFTRILNSLVTSGVYDTSLYVELRSRSWSNQHSLPVVVGTFTKAVPTNPGTFTIVWNAVTGTLLFDWSEVSDAFTYILTLDTTHVYRFSVPITSFAYDVTRNANDHSGTPDNAITYTLKVFDGLNQASSGLTGTSTLAPPSTPTSLTSSWVGDAAVGIAGPDCNVSWAVMTAIAGYVLTIDTVVHDTGLLNRYPYIFDKNRAEHSNVPDPSLSLSLVARNGLGQVSPTPALLTAVNGPPPTPAVTLIRGAVAGVIAIVSGVQAADFLAYEYVFKRDGTTVRTIESSSPVERYEGTGTGDGGFHAWTCAVRQRDMFGAYSAAITSSTISFEALTLDVLRQGIEYADSQGNSAAVLKAALADSSVVSPYITYGP